MTMRDCAHGRHGALVEDPPQDTGGSVQVERRCAACGLRVGGTSWTKAAWERQQANQAARTPLFKEG